MEDTLTIEQPQVQEQAPPQQDPPSKQLWQKLYDSKAYTNSYEDFQKRYSTPESIGLLHQKLSDAKAYTNSIDNFYTKYFPEKKSSAASNGLQNGAPKPTTTSVPSTLPSQEGEQQKPVFDPTAFLQTDMSANNHKVLQNADPLVTLADYHAKRTKDLNTQKDIFHSEILNINQDASVRRGDMVQPKLDIHKPLVPETVVTDVDKVYNKINDVHEYQKRLDNSVKQAASVVIAEKTKDPVVAGRMVRTVLGDKTAVEEQRYAEKELPISPAQQYSNELSGIDVLQTALDAKYPDKENPDYIIQKAQLDNEASTLINKYPEFKQQQLSKAIAQQIVKDHPNATGMMVMPYAKEAIKKLGLSEADVKNIDYDNLPIQGVASSTLGEIYNTALKIGAGIARPFGNLVGVDKDYLNAHIGDALKKGEERFADVSTLQNAPTIIDTNPKSNTYLQDIANPGKGKYNYNFHTISNAIGNGIGTLVGIVAGTKGFGSIAKSIAPTLTEAAAADIGMASTMIGQGYEPYYQKAREVISDKPQDEWKRHLYALLNGSLDYAVFKPLGKLQEVISPAAANELGAILRDAPSLEAVNKKMLTKWTAKVLEGAKSTVVETAKIGAAQVGGDIAKNIVDNIIGTPEAKKQADKTLGESIVSGITNLPFTMMIPLGFGEFLKGVTHSNVFQENIYNAGIHPETYLGEANDLLQKGSITQDQYNKRAQVINTARSVVNSIPEDIDLNHNQKVKYVNSKLKELALQAKADQIGDGALEGYYKDKIGEEVKNRISIINGGQKENEFLKPEEGGGVKLLNKDDLTSIYMADKANPELFKEFGNDVLSIADAYHKAQAEGKNPELVKKVDDILNKQEEVDAETEAAIKPKAAAAFGVGLSHGDWLDKNKDQFSPEDYTRLNDALNSTDAEANKSAVNEIVAKKEELKNAVVSPLTEPEKKEWNDLSMQDKLKLATENLPEVEKLSQLEIIKEADANAKFLLAKMHGEEPIEQTNIDVKDKAAAAFGKKAPPTTEAVEPAPKKLSREEALAEIRQNLPEVDKLTSREIADVADKRAKELTEQKTAIAEAEEKAAREKVNELLDKKLTEEQKYKSVEVVDPLTGELIKDLRKPNELASARRVKDIMTQRHGILEALIKCLT